MSQAQQTYMNSKAGFGLAAVLALATPAGAVNILSNPGFEDDDASAGDVYAATGWGGFNDVFTTRAFAHTGSQSLKIFGPFFPGGGAGAVQNFGAVAPGQAIDASAWAYTPTGDSLTPSNFAVVKLEYLDAGNAVIGFKESDPINTTSLALDTWTRFTVSDVAPAGTASAQLVLVHVQQDPVTGGAIYFDDASVELVPEPTSLALLAIGGLCAMRRRR